MFHGPGKPLFCILTNDLLAATRPVKPAATCLLFTVETEACLFRPLWSCAVCCCELPVMWTADSQKLVVWFPGGFGSARSLPVKVYPSFWMPFNGEGDWTHQNLYFPFTFFQEERSTFLSYDYLWLSVSLPLLISYFATYCCTTVQIVLTRLWYHNMF